MRKKHRTDLQYAHGKKIAIMTKWPSKQSSVYAPAAATCSGGSVTDRSQQLAVSSQQSPIYAVPQGPSFSATAPAATRPMVSRALARPPPLEARVPYFTCIAPAFYARAVKKDGEQPSSVFPNLVRIIDVYIHIYEHCTNI